MPLVTMRQLFDEAAAGGYGVGAFNVTNMEQIQGIMEAARAVQLGTAGHASDYAPLSLAQMRDRYADAAASGQTVTTGAAT